MAATSKTLLVFDFDHTVVDGNSDVVVQHLHPLPFPEEIKRLYSAGEGWTDYMGAIFSLLHQKGISSEQMKNQIHTVPLTSGMKELFEYLREDTYEVIIVSDANTLFIDWLLTKHGISQQVHCIYSNPAEFNEKGQLMIQYYHHQNWCDLSTKNMCKGHIVENHVKERRDQGVSFTRICYVGDGGNDYCPALRLSANDYVFARANFSLERKLKDGGSKVKANKVVWTDGATILSTLQELAD